MITINKIQDKFNTNPLFLFGLSSDEKPTDRFNGLKVVNGSEYTEVDTGKKYRFDESNTNWVEFSEGGGTAGGNMDYISEITAIPSIQEGMKGKVYTIGADGEYVLDPNQYYYVQKNWDILSKYDSLDFSGQPLATYPINNEESIDGIIMFKQYEWTYGLVDGYAVYSNDGTKIQDLPTSEDNAIKLSIYQYITKSSNTTPLRKGDTIICDGEKWIILNTALNEHSKGSVHSIGYWGNERAYEGCFEVTGTSWSGSKMFSLSSFINGYTGASKVIDYSVLLKLDGGGFVKTSMVGSGMDISAYLTNNNTLSIYTSATVSSVIFCIQYIP